MAEQEVRGQSRPGGLHGQLRVGALLAIHKSIQAAGCKCKFACAPPQVQRTLQRVNLHKVFELFGDEGAALSSF